MLAFPSSGDANAMWQGRIQENDNDTAAEGSNVGNDASPLEPGEGTRRWCGDNEHWISSKGTVAELCAQMSDPMLLMLRALRSELATHVAALDNADGRDTLQQWVLRVISTAANSKSSRVPQMVSKNANAVSEHLAPSKLPLKKLLSTKFYAMSEPEKDDFLSDFTNVFTVLLCLITLCTVSLTQIVCFVVRMFK